MPVTVGEPGHESVLRTLDDFDPGGRRVLVRVDFNVPMEAGRVADAGRLAAALPTLTELSERGARLILMSHLGRPKGRDPALSLAPVAQALGALAGRPVASLDQVVGPEAMAAAAALGPGDWLLLENLRFETGEKADDPHLAAQLAALGDAYVNDAFGTAHRAAASTVGVAGLLPAYAGRLMERELAVLGGALYAPKRPFTAIFGGAKISDKLAVLGNVIPKADRVLVGGGMANTFLLAAGIEMADSLVEPESLADAQGLLQAWPDRLSLPVDLVVAESTAGARSKVIQAETGLALGWRALDIGPDTVAAFQAALVGSATVVWNGPMGMFEVPPYDAGTNLVASAVAGLGASATTVVGGGDSAAAIVRAGLADQVTWVSTGGGAMLEFLAGHELPAVNALARPLAGTRT